MTEDISAIRARLTQALDAVTRHLETDNSADTVGLDQTRVGRVSRIDALQMRYMDQELGERAVRQRLRIEAALQRLDEGVYGLCCRCGEEVASERLHSDPAMPFCTDCQGHFDARRARV